MNQKDSQKNKPVTYYRIETLDRDTGEIEGGFMAVVNAALELTKGLPIPEIYKTDPDNYICLYRKEEYERFRTDW